MTDCHLQNRPQSLVGKSLENHERIKYALRLKGSSLADISRMLNVSKSCLTMVSKGDQRSRLVEAKIASILGEELHVAFPDRYQQPQ